MGEMKEGRYGQYYEYKDATGTIKRVSVKSKYITEDFMEKMIVGETVEYKRKSLYGEDTMHAKIVPATTKDGKPTQIIQYTVVSSLDDRETLKKNLNKLTTDECFLNGMLYKSHVVSVLSSLDLIKDCWKVHCEVVKSPLDVSEQTDSHIYDALIIYRDYGANSGINDPEMQALTAYYKCDASGTRLAVVDANTFLKFKNQFKQEAELIEQLKAAKQKALIAIRNTIYNDVRAKGLEAYTDSIDLDKSLDLGRFQDLQKLLVRNNRDPLHVLVYDSYPEIEDETLLKTNIDNMLKVYEAFNNIGQKNIDSLAKFIINHKLQNYYDDILLHGDIENIIATTKDKSLLKRCLVQIAGSGKHTQFLKTSSFYFERTVRVKEDIIVLNPVQLLNDLKDLIPVFNQNSEAAILVNVVLNDDESYTYQFYSYADDTSGGQMDGRRVAYMTKLYNRYHSTHIYFDYDEANGDTGDDE